MSLYHEKLFQPQLRDFEINYEILGVHSQQEEAAFKIDKTSEIR